ncbi:MAG: hypothetical protein M0D55_20030 [Elusimicrobiota bacterium]|nr:MAG: hypothetical protein M0D55_20030 [Elusimicrobiota bacterium]
MILSALALLLATAGPASAGPAPSPAVAASTSAAKVATSTATVGSIYTGDRSRDPFLPATMGGSSVRRPTDDSKTDGPELVDIHGMSLRGIMKDAKVDYALFTAETGGTYLLRGGKLYNEKNKVVPGITGAIRLKQKTVELVTADKDVQVFRLGEQEDKEKQP